MLPSGFLALSVAGAGDRYWTCVDGTGLVAIDKMRQAICGVLS